MLSISDNDFTMLTSYLKQNYGINLTKKKNLIEGRLSNYIVEHGFSTFQDYLASVFADKTGSEMNTMLNKLTTNHTYFMREWKSMEFYRDVILPDFLKKTSVNDLRVWSAGCSSGEEPYTLAMINRDFFTEAGGVWDTTVLATDISISVLSRASQGIYEEEAVNSLPAFWKLKYFQRPKDGKIQVTDALKKEIVFRVFNLMHPEFPFRRKFHVIFCRNVMIYFDTPTKARLIEKFYRHIEPGGYLIIGQSESLNRSTMNFRYIMPSIYRKE